MIDTDGVKTELQKFCDPEYSGYLGNVPDFDTAKQRAIDGWASALEVGFTAITPISTSLLAAKSAFQAAAVGMHISGAVFQAAINAFFATLATGMLVPGPAVSSTPPPGVYLPVSAGPSHETMCSDFAIQLTAFAQNGTATLNIPPIFPTVNWS